MITFKSIIKEQTTNFYKYITSDMFDRAASKGFEFNFPDGVYPEEEGADCDAFAFCDKDEYENCKETTIKMFNAMPNPIPIWRIISLPESKIINYDNLGVSWSFDLKGIKANLGITFIDKSLPYIAILSARVFKENVNWADTVELWLQFSFRHGEYSDVYGSESEITLHNPVTKDNLSDFKVVSIKKNKHNL